MSGKGIARPLTVLTVIILLLLPVLLLAGCAGKGGGAKQGSLTVGAKDFTESTLLGEMTAQLIEGNSAIHVIRKLSLGGTSDAFNAIRKGSIDLYPEYDSTAWDVHLGHTLKPSDPAKLPDQVRQELAQKYKLSLTGPLGFDNHYVLAVPEQLASRLELQTYTDLAKVSKQFVFGTNQEFMAREVDGYHPLIKAYGFTFKEARQMAAGARYQAMERNEIQAMDAYATDGRLKQGNVRLLRDDRNFFLPACSRGHPGPTGCAEAESGVGESAEPAHRPDQPGSDAGVELPG